LESERRKIASERYWDAILGSSITAAAVLLACLLPRYKRRIAETLASSETTKATARKFRVSPGRISQTRRELETAWQEFQGESART